MRYLSGIQPSGVLHIGNYFGAIRQHIQSQDEHDSYYFIADYHALTTVRDAEVLRENVLGVALDYLSLGLDPEKTTFFRHSEVPEVQELAWVLSTLTPMGLLERCHSYKDKIAKGIAPDHGLFAYPVLMASDILIYDSNRVPVGKDQVQHIEVTRDIAQRLNHIYGNGGEILVIPEAQVEESTAVVPGIDGQKMSKSYDNTLEMFASEKKLKKAIGKIVTDSRTPDEPKDPEEIIMYQLYRLFASADELETMAERYRGGGYGYGDAKKDLLEKLLDYFAPYRKKREELASDPAGVYEILSAGAAQARATAQATVERVYKAVGLR